MVVYRTITTFPIWFVYNQYCSLHVYFGYTNHCHESCRLSISVNFGLLISAELQCYCYLFVSNIKQEEIFRRYSLIQLYKVVMFVLLPKGNICSLSKGRSLLSNKDALYTLYIQDYRTHIKYTETVPRFSNLISLFGN